MARKKIKLPATPVDAKPVGKKINVALIGVGNCAAALLHALWWYKREPHNRGLISAFIGGYSVRDINIVGAFDIDYDKLEKSVGTASVSGPNNFYGWGTSVEDGFFQAYQNAMVYPGLVSDGVSELTRQRINVTDHPPSDVTKILQSLKTDVVINYLPVGSENATVWYTEHILRAGCAMINCIPVFIASTPRWSDRFLEAGLPIIGDDIKSQLGATIVHRQLTALFASRGIRIEETYQLNFGGNMDFYNMLDRKRLQSKKKSKTQAVTSATDQTLCDNEIHVGPSDYVPSLEDKKVCHIYMRGIGVAGFPVELDLKLKVHDSPNSAGVVLDAIRYAKVAKDNKIGGALLEESALLMKSPPEQMEEVIAKQRLDEKHEKLWQLTDTK